MTTAIISKDLLEITTEPYCSLSSSTDLVRWEKQNEVVWNQTHRQRQKYQFYISAFDFITDNGIIGDYLEFGCHKVRTFRMALTEARHHNIEWMNFHAFDSFEGLPPSDESHQLGNRWSGGALTTTVEQFRKIIRQHGLFPETVFTYPGFYDKTLTTDMRNHPHLKGRMASLICIDCDLYESAVPVFSFIEEFIQEGTVIYIDDWWCGYRGNPNKGVSKAFFQFQEKSKFHFAEYLNVGAFGKSFISYT